MLTSRSVTTASASRSELGEFGIDDLVSLLQNIDEILGLTAILRREKGITGAGTFGTSCPADPVDVILGRRRIIKVDDVLYVINV